MNARCIAIGLGLVVTTASHGQRIGTEAWWAATNAQGVQQVNIHCGTDFLDPKEVVVRQNVAVEITVRSTENLRDNIFQIEQLPSSPSLPIIASANALRFVPTVGDRSQCYASRMRAPIARASPVEGEAC
jgi:hypothetical protein